MKKSVLVVGALLLSGTAMAESKFWFFSKTVDSQTHYTRILSCDEKSLTITDTTFSVSDATGPFEEYTAAETARNKLVFQAQSQGREVKLSLGKCPKN